MKLAAARVIHDEQPSFIATSALGSEEMERQGGIPTQITCRSGTASAPREITNCAGFGWGSLAWGRGMAAICSAAQSGGRR